MRVHPTQANKRNNTHTCLIPSQVESIEEEKEAESLDSHGIPGWDKVDQLARALLDLCGLSVTNIQAASIKTLYADLLEYDKYPLGLKPRHHPPPRGRFARSKSIRLGHVGVVAMRR